MRDLVNFNQFGANPLRMLDDIEKDMRRFLETFPAVGTIESSAERFMPVCDIKDKDSYYVISLDIPGIPKDDVEIEVSNGQLRVSGERRSEKKEADYSERRYGKFERIMTLPEGVKEEDIEANYENGVLSIAVPKTEFSQTEQRKKIPISEGKKEGVWKKLSRGKSEEKSKKAIKH